jgi:uncharacterized protein DUF2798
MKIQIPKRYTNYVFAFFMAGIMAFLMCMVIVAANIGFYHDYVSHVIHAYLLAMPVAFVCVLFVRPIVVKLVALVVTAD